MKIGGNWQVKMFITIEGVSLEPSLKNAAQLAKASLESSKSAR